MIKFLSGMLVMLFLVSMVNCSGTLPAKPSRMEIIQHGQASQVVVPQEKVPCE